LVCIIELGGLIRNDTLCLGQMGEEAAIRMRTNKFEIDMGESPLLPLPPIKMTCHSERIPRSGMNEESFTP